jgi:protease-4
MKSTLKKVSSALTAIRVWTINLLTLAVLVYVLLLVVAVIRQMPESVDPDGRVLILNPEGVVVDQAVYPRQPGLSALLQQEEQIQTRDLVDLIRAAADDKRLAGVLLDFSKTAFSGPTTALTVAEELARLRESGKPVIAYSEALSTGSYLMAAQAEEIYVHPGGAVGIMGLGGYRNYVKEMLDKLKVSVHDYSQGDYKSAAESITRTSMSDADRRQREELIEPIWEHMKSRMAAARGVEPELIQQLADEYPAMLLQGAYDNLRVAQAEGLIDGTLSYADFRALMMDKFGADEASERETYPHIVFNAYARQLEREKEIATSEISVVFVEGTIQEGESGPGAAGAEDIGRLMREAYEDDDTRAIVLRVNSPGGGLLASELIRDEVLAARARSLPVVVSMGDLAASGGMFVSAPANRIFAQPTTITGSIGVAIVIPTFENSLEHIGVNSDGTATSNFAGWGLKRPIDEKLDAVFRQLGSSSYQRFIDIVSEGRQRDEAYIRSIAGGRVWSGEKALELGLVDELGGLEDAIAAAAEIAGVGDYRTEYRFREPPFSVKFIRRFMRDALVEADSPLGAFGRRVGVLFQAMEDLSRPRVSLVCNRCLVELQ